MTQRNTLAALLVAAALAGCATAKKEPPPKPFAATRWQLAMELPLAGEQPNVRFGDGRLEGFGGCNRFAARYVQDSVGARAIAIGRIEMNRRLCEPGAQAAESRVLDTLQAVSSYTITGDTMTMSGSGGTLKFRALPEETGTGMTIAAGPTPASLLGTRWKGVVDPSLNPGATPWIEFAEGRFSGFSGCNLLSGAWRSDGGQIRLGPIAMTKRGCMGPEGDVERRLMAVLNGEARVNREGERLVITGPGGDRFEFVAASPG
jgi:heat shock protein HslJ